MKSAKSEKTRKIVIALLAVICGAVFVICFAAGIPLLGYKDVSVFFNADTGVRRSSGEDFVKIMDVGQGDSILVYSNGYSAVIDTGISSRSADICADLESAGISVIDVMLISHLHDDHTGGITALADKYRIDNLIAPEAVTDNSVSGAVQSVRETVIENGGNVYTPVQGMNFNIGEFEVTVLAHFSDMSDENNRSVIAMAEIDGLKFLLTGDAERKAETALLGEGLNLDCDVLKAGHHGSNTSSGKELLEFATPEYAAISVGEHNSYSHPGTDTLRTLGNCGAEIFRTDTNGDIVFYVENGKIRAETEK